MEVIVVHKDSGYTVTHKNVDRIKETVNRFEVIDKRRRGSPLTSTSYHKSLYTFTVVQ